MTIFFDLDDTLYDRGLPFMLAAEEFFGRKLPDPRKAYRTCSARGNEAFLPSQRGEITMEEMTVYRWGRGFEDVGIPLAPKEALDFQRVYMEKQTTIALSRTMEALLTRCRDAADCCGIITNGPTDKQWKKIDLLGLERFFDREMLIVSGDVGIDKPDPAIFRMAEARSGAEPGQLLYVGDSLKTDIAPAIACGWKTIWLNRDGVPRPENLPITAEVSSEEALAEAIRAYL